MEAILAYVKTPIGALIAISSLWCLVSLVMRNRVMLAVGMTVLGAGVAVRYLGSIAGDLTTSLQPAQSPDDVADSHGLGFLITVGVMMLVGWFLGWIIGGFIKRRES